MTCHRNQALARGFTLVELLVVIAIISVMMATLLPAVNGMREAARRSTCENKMARLMIALADYQSANESLPPGVLNPGGPIRSEATGSHHGWLEQVLPYLDEDNIYRHIDFSVSIYQPQNTPVRRLRPAEFVCPSETNDDLPASSYAGCHNEVEAPIDDDNHGVLFLNSKISSDDIPDGAGHTIFVGEKIVSPNDLGWMSGTRATLRNTGHPINPFWPTHLARTPAAPPAAETQPPAAEGEQSPRDNPRDEEPAEAEKEAEGEKQPEGQAPAAENMATDAKSEATADDAAKPTAEATEIPALEDNPLFVGGFSSYHPTGAVFGLGDGSVHFIVDEIDPQLFQWLGNRADGSLIDNEALR
ncbi:MAG TPA: DUF1559 domain-containing protein [Pirellulales bacterium]|nr:DUF1559 domain-containing protein [Pirellulales bacterium]